MVLRAWLTSDGNFVIASSSTDYELNGEDIYIVKTDDGNYIVAGQIANAE